jgi:hypothetical protein
MDCSPGMAAHNPAVKGTHTSYGLMCVLGAHDNAGHHLEATWVEVVNSATCITNNVLSTLQADAANAGPPSSTAAQQQ